MELKLKMQTIQIILIKGTIITITNEFDGLVEDNDYEFFENTIKLFKDDEK